jgi:hypothetical protein
MCFLPMKAVREVCQPLSALDCDAEGETARRFRVVHVCARVLESGGKGDNLNNSGGCAVSAVSPIPVVP